MDAILSPATPATTNPQPLTPEREVEIRKFRDQAHPVTGILAVARVHDALNDLLGEVDRLRAERQSTNSALVELTVELRASVARVGVLTKLLERAQAEARTANAEAGA
ncbi:hypothetical protein V2E29_04815 [Streptomyces diastatochromogenes]|uniref:hypothetical protein n=1 Tax=Streptomyces diastatochromogenes TaxID=42236 RepID=UPI002F26D48B